MNATQFKASGHDEEQPVVDDVTAMTLDELTEILGEIEEQPRWRHQADKEMDYADGKQLDSELLRRQQELGIPPAVEDLVGPALLSIQGYEAASRTDWRVTPDGDVGGQDVADALNYRLNQAERHSRADRACSDAFRTQCAVGIGFVEVRRETDPFKYPYRCQMVPRNEIHWDFQAQEDDLSDAGWLIRQKWLKADRIATKFPQHREVIKEMGASGATWFQSFLDLDGGSSTGLHTSAAEAQNWSVQEHRWYNGTSQELCLIELWYRRWVEVACLRSPDGRVVEFDQHNLVHVVAVASGKVKPFKAISARVRRAYWLGPHCLSDEASPYPHAHFPYVPFWGFREDNTRVPYGYVRGMIFPQDSLNSGISKLRWGMSSVRTIRTDGATDMSDAQLRRQIARVDADIKLNAEHFRNNPGARFEVERDFQLNNQQFQLLQDNRQAIQRVSAVTSGFMGKEGTARSGLQERTQVEQSNQSLGRLMDNFRAGRTQVGELLIAMLIEDMGDEEQVVVIEGDAVREDRTVIINKPEVDPATGQHYLSNDLQRTRLKVALEDVPSTPGYRAQQLASMSEAVKALPPQYQAAMMPFLVSLMDVPFKRDVVEAIRAAGEQESPEQIEQRVQQAVQEALAKSGAELKMRELAMKEGKTEAEIEKIRREAVLIGVQAAYSAMQGGAQIATMPQIAPIADAVMKSAGYQAPNPGGEDPNYPTASQTAAVQMKDPYVEGEGRQVVDVQQNSSPAFPPVPQGTPSAMTGIETPNTTDNIQGAAQ